MGLNFLGLGFALGAKDVGLGDAMAKVQGDFEKIGGQIHHINLGGIEAQLSEIVSELRTIAEKFHETTEDVRQDQRKIAGGFDRVSQVLDRVGEGVRQLKLLNIAQAFSLDRLGDVEDQLGRLAGTSQALTTGFEATLVAHTKTTKQMGVNMGFMGQDLRKFQAQATSMAIDLNIGADAAAMAVRGWAEAHEALGATGLENASDLAKLVEVTGVSADVFRNTSLQMRKEFGLQDAEIKAVFESMTAMGQATGDVSSALGEMPAVMERMRKKAALMGQEMDPEQLAEFARQQAALATGFFQTGHNSEQARASAAALSDAILEGQKNIQNMFAGTEDDLSGLATELGIATGDISQSFDLMRQGPAGFVEGLTQVVQGAKKAGRTTADTMGFLRARLEKALGDDAANRMMTFFETANESTFAAMQQTMTTTTSLKDLARQGFSTGRTLSERMELAKDQMVTSFRAISKASSRAFVDDSQKQFKVFSRGLRNIVSDKGPLGAFVGKLSEAHQLGVLAFLPETLRPFGAVLGDVTKEMVPMLHLMATLGPKALMVLGPIGLLIGVVGSLAGWFVTLRGEGKSTEQALGIIGKSVEAFFKSLPSRISTGFRMAGRFGERVAAWARDVDWAQVGRDVAAGLASLFHEGGQVRRQVGGAFGEMMGGMGSAASALIQGMVTAFSAIDWYTVLGQSNFETVMSVLNGIKAGSLSIWEFFERLTNNSRILVDGLRAIWGEWKADMMALFFQVGSWWREHIDDPILRFYEMLVRGKDQVISSFATVGKAIGEAFKDPMSAFETIDKWVDKLFRNSIHDDVEKSMSLAEEKFGAHADRMIGDIGRLAGMSPTVTGALRAPATEAAPAALRPAIGSAELAMLTEAVHAPRWYHSDLKPLVQEALRVMRDQGRKGDTIDRSRRRTGGPSTNSSGDDLGLEQRLAYHANGMPR